MTETGQTVDQHRVQYGNPGNGPFLTEPTAYRPEAEKTAANKLAAGWADVTVVTEPVPPHAFHASHRPGCCAVCEQQPGHPLHAPEAAKHVAVAAVYQRSQCGAGSDLYYLYADPESMRWAGCIYEPPRDGRTYKTRDRRRRPTEVTMAEGFKRVWFPKSAR